MSMRWRLGLSFTFAAAIVRMSARDLVPFP